MDLDKLNQFLARILWPNQDQPEALVRELVENDAADAHTPSNNDTQQQELFRVKGVVSIYDTECNAVDDRRYIVQAVQDVWDVHPSSNLKWGVEERRQCQLVVIGRHLDKRALKEGFGECRVDHSS